MSYTEIGLHLLTIAIIWDIRGMLWHHMYGEEKTMEVDK